jgi:hypothetical protein
VGRGAWAIEWIRFIFSPLADQEATVPRYRDYHRTVIGYHGTKWSVAQDIVRGEAEFEPSRNGYDWLGHGVYFWEYAPQQAFLWARQLKRSKGWTEEIAVIGSMIRLGNCLDLLDPGFAKDLKRFHEGYLDTMDQIGEKPPPNIRQKRLNCAVFNFAYQTAEEEGDPIDSCRAVFVPTADRLWDASGINPQAHVQICVREPDCILGTWWVKPREE